MEASQVIMCMQNAYLVSVSTIGILFATHVLYEGCGQCAGNVDDVYLTEPKYVWARLFFFFLA